MKCSVLLFGFLVDLGLRLSPVIARCRPLLCCLLLPIVGSDRPHVSI